jgi:hypothetical protein
MKRWSEHCAEMSSETDVQKTRLRGWTHAVRGQWRRKTRTDADVGVLAPPAVFIAK